ncbi:hypothetical protein AVEN_46746-1 [Araneus ventricosus]|uniref:Uncharacterized protein n=1 Tax=Araneus ventricosus TaxID=182803 RepID=A0A4Y2SPA4_ARAVE|nr:hypothetical protein AVEN_46746-1 [Araneus ventricosus]
MRALNGIYLNFPYGAAGQVSLPLWSSISSLGSNITKGMVYSCLATTLFGFKQPRFLSLRARNAVVYETPGDSEMDLVARFFWAGADIQKPHAVSTVSAKPWSVDVTQASRVKFQTSLITF